MMLPPSLRSYGGELRYQSAKERGETRDIAKIPGPNLGGLKILPNEYPYDSRFAINDMLVDSLDSSFWDYWIKVGTLIEEGKLDTYDQFIYNLPAAQSQPHVFHNHLTTFKKREDFIE